MAGTDLAYLPSAADVRGRKADYLAVAQELRNAVEAIPAMAWAANPDGTNAFVSRRWAEYVGLPPGQHVFSDWEAVVHPDDLKRSTENWIHCVATGEPFEEEIRLRRADGRYRWFLDRGVGVKDEGGAIARWYGVATDIDDRKQAEAILAAEKQLLEMIATGALLGAVLRAICLVIEEQQEGTRASVLMLNGDGVRLHVVAAPSISADMELAMRDLPVGPNAGPCGVAIYTRAPVIVADVSADVLWEAPSAQQLAQRHQIRASWSTPIFSPKREVLGTVSVYCREPGGPTAHDSELLRLATYIAGVAIDRDRSEQALRRSEAYLGEAERLAHTGSWARDPANTQWVYWSAETFRVFGLNPVSSALPQAAEFCGFIHPDDREKHRDTVASAAREKRDYELEYRAVLPGGTIKYLHDIGHPVIDSTGEIVEWVGTIVDVTERKRGEQERDRVRRLEAEREAAIAQERSRLAGEMHDTLAQGLAMIVMQLADAQTKLGSAWTLAERPLSLVRELAVESLAYARRSVSALRVPAELAGLVPTLQDVVDRLRRHFEGTLSLVVSGDSAGVEQAVESAFAAIAREALTNAVKHSSASRISTELEFSRCGAVRLVVTDDGVGFDATSVRADAYGLVSMQERASRVGVALTFVTEQGAGTTIVASWAGPATLTESRQGALLHPVDVQESLREQPGTSSLHEGVEVP